MYFRVQDDKTVFVSNLAYSTTKQELEDIFAKVTKLINYTFYVIVIV